MARPTSNLSRTESRRPPRLACFLGSVTSGIAAAASGADLAVTAASSSGFAPLALFMAASFAIAVTAGLSWDCLFDD